MDIYIQSAGSIKGYEARSRLGTRPVPSEVVSWHNALDKDDAAFALVAGRINGTWYIEYRHLYLPEMVDRRNRPITLSICFGGLRTEAEVRALALAYQDFENIFDGTRCLGRYCEALAQAYRPTETGDYRYNIDAAEEWAAEAILRYMDQLQLTYTGSPTVFLINNPEDKKVDDIESTLRQYRLQDKDGMRLFWTSSYAPSACPADIVVKPEIQSTATAKNATAFEKFVRLIQENPKETAIAISSAAVTLAAVLLLRKKL